MLVLTRKNEESINIGDDIIIKVIETSKNSVKIGIEAPQNIIILRHEVFESIQQENIISSRGDVSDISEAAYILIKNKKYKRDIKKEGYKKNEN